MKPQTYEERTKQCAPKSKVGINCLWAFVTGGLICVLGQALMLFFQSVHLTKEEISMAVPVTLVFLGAFFTALGLYDKAARYAGAGTLVPITGFSNAVVSPAMEFKCEGFVLGTCAKMFIVSGPVIVFGLLASVLYGIIRLIFC